MASARRIAAAEGADVDVCVTAALLHELFNYPKSHPESSRSGDVCAEHATAMLREHGYDAAFTRAGGLLHSRALVLARDRARDARGEGAAGCRPARCHRRHRHRALLRDLGGHEAAVLRAGRSVLPRARARRQAMGHRSLLQEAVAHRRRAAHGDRARDRRPSGSRSCARISISSSAKWAGWRAEVVEPAVDAADADARLFGRHRPVVHGELRQHRHAPRGAARVGAHERADRLRRTARGAVEPLGGARLEARDRRSAPRRPAAARPSWRRRSRATAPRQPADHRIAALADSAMAAAAVT